jgi:hypothetical protein
MFPFINPEEDVSRGVGDKDIWCGIWAPEGVKVEVKLSLSTS